MKLTRVNIGTGLISMFRLVAVFIIVTPFAGKGQVQLERFVTASGGNSVVASGIILDYTIGEPAVTTLNAGGSILTQGFQQPDLINVGITDAVTGSFTISLYPNPVHNDLHVMVSSSVGIDLHLEIFDISGKITVQFEAFFPVNTTASVLQIDVSHLKPAPYMVRITDQITKRVQHIRIIKSL
jgi:hypothetical protein